PQPLTLNIRAHLPNAQGTLSLQLPTGWAAPPSQISLHLPQTNSLQTHTFLITPPKQPTQTTTPSAALFAIPVLHSQARSFSWAETQLHYPHIPAMTVLQPASVRLVPLQLHLPQGSFAYIQGSGDRIPEALQQIGLPLRVLTDKEIITADLSRFRSILIGIRAFNANTTLQSHKQRLWDYVAQGGTLIVQYTAVQWWRPFQIAVAPFPLTIGRQRITQEDAPVTLLNPQHPLFQTPHPIGPQDFHGWTQERGLYFASAWHQTAIPLLRMADPNEPPQDGALLLGHHGKGAYLYTGLSFFRQLPAGVPGAYRLLLNLLAYTPSPASPPTRTP
ncbi:PIG-L family deacetylase, partial [Myxococcota bacterium]|nr:PIG-L family deacetylase [Myxococcota bacterium]